MKKLFIVSLLLIVAQTVVLTLKGNRWFGFHKIQHLELLSNALLLSVVVIILWLLVRTLFSKDHDDPAPKVAPQAQQTTSVLDRQNHVHINPLDHIAGLKMPEPAPAVLSTSTHHDHAPEAHQPIQQVAPQLSSRPPLRPVAKENLLDLRRFKQSAHTPSHPPKPPKKIQ